jgi:hypothetical protein
MLVVANRRNDSMTVTGAGIRVCLLVWAYSVLFGATSLLAQDYTRDSRPELFSYDELVQLGASPEMSQELAAKLHVVTTTPFINNEAYLSGSRPRALEVKGLVTCRREFVTTDAARGV